MFVSLQTVGLWESPKIAKLSRVHLLWVGRSFVVRMARSDLRFHFMGAQITIGGIGIGCPMPSWLRSEIPSTFQMNNWSCNINKFLIYLRGPPEFYHSPGFICSLDIANLKDCYIYKDILLCQIMYYRPIFVLVTTRFEAQLHIEVYIIPFLNSHESCLLRVRSSLEDKRATSRWNPSVSGIDMGRAGLGTNSVLTTLLLRQLYTNFLCCVTLLALYLYYMTGLPKAILLAHFFQGLISGMTIDRGCSWTPTWSPPDSPDLLAYRVILALSLSLTNFWWLQLSFCVHYSAI